MNPRIRGITAILLIAWAYEAHGIIGYDCGSPLANLTTVSLLNIEECDIPPQNVNTSLIYIQLVQINEYNTARVIQCKVEIDRTVKKCGMFSHTMDVLNGKYAYIEETSREACQRMHLLGIYRIGQTFINGLRSNQTISRPITIAGSLDNDGSCQGSAYTDPYGSWLDVIVIATIKITLQDYVADVRLNTNQVMLRSGVTCGLSATHCVDIEGGDTYWEPVPRETCAISNYGTLFDGFAEKLVDTTAQQSQVVYSLNSQDTVFALTSKGKYTMCGYTLIRTEHPKLLIFETTSETRVFRKQYRPQNLDIFTYMNSKFVYVEKHVRTQISQLYRNVLLQQCNLEQRILKNALALATHSPDAFAYHIMQGPGYMALLAGEVIHIVKCVPVEVRLAKTEECYDQLPVIRGNETQFLTPQTHILLRQGTQVTCNSLAPAMYLLGDSWYRFTPKPVEALPPVIMKPMTRPTWKYISPGSLATSGIYTEDDLENLRDHIMFPAERPAVLNTVARGMMGQPGTVNGGSFSNLLDEASIEKIAISAWEKFWNRFLIFGNVSAGIIGIYLSIRAVKLILDTFVHGYALHTVYGWSVYLVGAIWDSVTQLLLHLGRRKPEAKRFSASAPVEADIKEVRFSELQNDPKQQYTYPLLPPEGSSTYTLELKG